MSLFYGQTYQSMGRRLPYVLPPQIRINYSGTSGFVAAVNINGLRMAFSTKPYSSRVVCSNEDAAVNQALQYLRENVDKIHFRRKRSKDIPVEGHEGFFLHFSEKIGQYGIMVRYPDLSLDKAVWRYDVIGGEEELKTRFNTVMEASTRFHSIRISEFRQEYLKRIPAVIT